MPIAQSDKEDVLTTVKIELERMFTVLSNAYGSPELHDRSVFLKEIEKTLGECVKSLRQEPT